MANFKDLDIIPYTLVTCWAFKKLRELGDVNGKREGRPFDMDVPNRHAYYDDTTHRWRIWTRQDCLDALRLACVGDDPPTIHEFNQMHRVEPSVYPSVATIRNQCGGWANALRAIGQEPRGRGRANQRGYEEEYRVRRTHEYDLEYSGEYRTEWD